MITALDPLLMAAVDACFALIPRRRPAAEALAAAQIWSHRGERDDREVLENTFASFDPLVGSGVHGLECDVRFTRDRVPMVFHDADLQRLYGCRERLQDLDRADLQQRFPRIPTLTELVQRYAGRLALMIEFKAEPRPDPETALRAVARALEPLRPRRDYHLLSLDCPTLDWLGGLEGAALVPIARSNVAEMADYAARHRCAGLTGHYALLGARDIAAQRQAGRPVGVGFPRSRHALRFALNRGVHWIFTNQAVRLQRLLDQDRAAARKASSS